LFSSLGAGDWIAVVPAAAIAFLLGVVVSARGDAAADAGALRRGLIAAAIAAGAIAWLTLALPAFAGHAINAVLALAAAALGVALLRRPGLQARERAAAIGPDEAGLLARLGESRGLYRALAEAASDAIVISQDLRIAFANQAAARLVGADDAAQLVGRPIMDFIPPESQALARQRQQRLYAGQLAPLIETRYLKLDGTPIDVEVSSAPFVLDGRTAIVAIVRDVTARKRMEAALRRSEARFRGLTDLSTDWYSEQDAQLVVTFTSDRYAAKDGLNMAPVTGQTHFETDNLWESEQQRREHRDTLAAHRPYRDVRVSRHDRDGVLHYLSLSGNPLFDERGGFAGYYGIGRDITAQQRVERALRDSEARFRSLTELSSDWFWEQDEALRFTERCSEGIAKSGFDVDKLIGRRRRDLPHYDTMTDADWAPIEQATARRAPFRDFILRARNKHGELRHLSISGAPFFHPDGRFAGYRGVGVDVTERERQREQLQMFRLALETSAEAIFITDLESLRYLDVNETACRMLGYSREELLAMGPHDVNPNLTRADLEQRFAEARSAGPDRFTTESANRFLQRKDGAWVPIEATRRYLRIGRRDVIVSVARDVSARIAADNALRLRDRALESSVNAVVITRAGGDHEVEYVNPAFEHLTGYPAGEVIGRNLRFLQGTDRGQPDLPKLRGALRDGQECAVLMRNYAKNGAEFWNDLRIAPVRDSGDCVTHFVGVLNDISVAKRFQDELAHQATHDALTGIPNRTLLADRLEQSIGNARRHERLFAVVFVDLDHFKHINDALGHRIGDAVLREIASRLSASVRDGDTLARYAGDEFVIILNDLDGEQSIGDTLLRLRQAVSQPVAVEGRELTVTCSMGASVFPRDGTTADDLLRHADAAMYGAKDDGRDGYRFFTSGLNDQSALRLEMESRLRRALEAGEFFLEYQPKISLDDGGVTGVEALIRWKHPELGVVPPNQFIPLAEETGLVVAMGLWALREASRQIARWRREHGLEIAVAVNLSARQFRQHDLVETIGAILAEHDVAPRLLHCEVTESAMLHDVDAATGVLQALRELGAQVSLDDFGTGYSSLSYLKRLPIDSVKIDRSFVRDVSFDPEDAKIVQAIIGLAKALDLTAIAEGVETPEQACFLRQHGCHQAQGYLYSKPLPAGALTRWLLARRQAGSGDARLRVAQGPR
jgi:diguanylate cyclase (GGDEF)-like protein/PAS domain S-box-containing protein